MTEIGPPAQHPCLWLFWLLSPSRCPAFSPSGGFHADRRHRNPIAYGEQLSETLGWARSPPSVSLGWPLNRQPSSGAACAPGPRSGARGERGTAADRPPPCSHRAAEGCPKTQRLSGAPFTAAASCGHSAQPLAPGQESPEPRRRPRTAASPRAAAPLGTAPGRRAHGNGPGRCPQREAPLPLRVGVARSAVPDPAPLAHRRPPGSRRIRPLLPAGHTRYRKGAKSPSGPS